MSDIYEFSPVPAYLIPRIREHELRKAVEAHGYFLISGEDFQPPEPGYYMVTSPVGDDGHGTGTDALALDEVQEWIDHLEREIEDGFGAPRRRGPGTPAPSEPPKGPNTMTNTATAPARPIERRFDRDRPRVSHVTHLRQLEMPDGRKLLVDRRAVAFLCEGRPEDFNGKTVTIVGFRTVAKPCPVTAGFNDLRDWWFGNAPAGNGKADRQNAPAAA